MNAENLDPATQAQTIWSDTLALIKQNSRLTAREQGWLAGVTAEAVVGTTIILDVENADIAGIADRTQRADHRRAGDRERGLPHVPRLQGDAARTA